MRQLIVDRKLRVCRLYRWRDRHHLRYPVLWASSESSHRQGIYADGPSPLRTTRQFQRYDEIAKPEECCHAVISLHAQGWNMRDDCSLSGGVATNGLRHSEEVGRGRGTGARLEKSHANTSKTGVDLPTRKKQEENPLLEEWRMFAALKQRDTSVSPRTRLAHYGRESSALRNQAETSRVAPTEAAAVQSDFSP